MDTVLDKTKRFTFNGGAFTRFLARLLLAGVFATAATAKMQSMGDFERTLMASHLVPTALVSASAAVVISLELVVAVGLLAPLLRPNLQIISLKMAAVISATFLSYSAWRWVEDIPVPCQCFGVLFRIDPPFAILLNLFLLAIAFYALSGSGPMSTREYAMAKEVK